MAKGNINKPQAEVPPFDDHEVDDSVLPNGGAHNASHGGDNPEDVWNQGVQMSADPIGVFNGTIVEATLSNSKSSGKLQIAYVIAISGGEHNGRKVRKFDGLSTPEQVKIASDGLRALGIDSSKYSLKTLPAALLNVQGKFVEFEGRKSGQYYNIYFRKIIGAPGSSFGDSDGF